MSQTAKSLPLVYACSGCSSAAQMANYVALQLDRQALAEMSCIAGVGGNVPHLVRIAQSGRPILALDGCPLQCVKSSLAQRGLSPSEHVLLHEQGVKKKYRTDFDADQAQRILAQVAQLARSLAKAPLQGAAHPPATDRALSCAAGR